jgi:hypothetical protein
MTKFDKHVFTTQRFDGARAALTKIKYDSLSIAITAI